MAGERAGRGKLQLFLAAAAGAGKTSAMLAEGHRRAALGDDVVVGLAETHGRPGTEAEAAVFAGRSANVLVEPDFGPVPGLRGFAVTSPGQ